MKFQLDLIYKTINIFHKPVRKKTEFGKVNDIETFFQKYVFLIQKHLTLNLQNANHHEPVSYYSNLHIGQLYLNQHDKYVVMDYVKGAIRSERLVLIENNRNEIESLTIPFEMRLVHYILSSKEINYYYSINN